MTDAELTPLDAETYDTIIARAESAYRAWSRGVRGQIVRPEDGFDYWVACVVYAAAREQAAAKVDTLLNVDDPPEYQQGIIDAAAAIRETKT